MFSAASSSIGGWPYDYASKDHSRRDPLRPSPWFRPWGKVCLPWPITTYGYVARTPAQNGGKRSNSKQDYLGSAPCTVTGCIFYRSHHAGSIHRIDPAGLNIAPGMLHPRRPRNNGDHIWVTSARFVSFESTASRLALWSVRVAGC